MSPIYEYHCLTCSKTFERLELSACEIPTSQCTNCMGVGVKIISRPSIICEVFDPKATHKLPGWQTQMKAAQVRDAKVRRAYRHLPPMPHDQGQGIRVYEADFGHQERKALERKAQLDNV